MALSQATTSQKVAKSKQVYLSVVAQLYQNYAKSEIIISQTNSIYFKIYSKVCHNFQIANSFCLLFQSFSFLELSMSCILPLKECMGMQPLNRTFNSLSTQIFNILLFHPLSLASFYKIILRCLYNV